MRGWLHIIFIVCAFASCSDSDNDHSHRTSADTVKAITASPSRVVASSQRTVKPHMMSSITSQVTSNGIIAADERRNNNVSVKVGGRIEKLYARFDYQYIKAGSPVMEIYSPELNTVAEEYLLLYKASTDQSLVSSGRKRLSLLGLTEGQISGIEKNNKVPRTFTVYSSYSGYLFLAPSSIAQAGSNTSGTSTSMEAMGATSTTTGSYSATAIREGAYVNKGQTMFTVNDLQQVWALITISPGMNVNKGDSIRINTGQSIITEKIDFIEPVFQQGQKFSRARVYLENRESKYSINDLFTAVLLSSKSSENLSVPIESVLHLGQRSIVWVRTGKAGNNNLFEARTVTVGQTYNGYIEILSGLEPNEKVAETAGFMIDSESLIE